MPLEDAIAPAVEASEDVFWIFGNHDVDQVRFYTHLVDSALADRHLHGRVVEIDGLRVAGLSGHFQGRIWHPHDGDGSPRVARREEFLARMPPRDRWRGGLPPKLQGAIWWEDIERLWDQRADILVTHEAPSCHPYGTEVIDDLAAAMGVRLVVHGHQHVTYVAEYQDRELTVMGVGLAAVATGEGTVLVPGELDEARGAFVRSWHGEKTGGPVVTLRTMMDGDLVD